MVNYEKLNEKDFKTAYIAAWMAQNGNAPREAMNAADRAWDNLIIAAKWNKDE